ncbi:MAG TPA: hypothetical protein VGO47_12030 [Chlamydiales bacterium]|nr:hypothetical protein [Chlamydiales bacterium]
MLSAQLSLLPEDFVWRNHQPAEDPSSGVITHDTRSSLSNTYAESSKSILLDKVLASDKRSQLRSGLKSSRAIYPALFERYLHNKTGESIELFENLNALHNFYTDRWNALPVNPSNEKEIARGFFSIAKKVVAKLGGPDTDLFDSQLFDTHLNRIPDDHGNSHLQPDLFVKGSGRHFPVVAHSKLSAPPWAVCLTIGDFKLGVSKNKEQYFAQLATYAEQLLSAQDNRRFVEAFCMDEQYLVFLIFDRGGSVTSDQVDYQRDPWKLIALVQYLLLGRNREAIEVGIDDSVYYENGQTYIQTPSRHPSTKQDTWLLLKTLFRATDLRGPGTIFWLVQDVNNHEMSKKIRLIKDEWVVGGIQYEQDLHQLVGSLSGVAPLEFSYDVKFGNQLDIVRENRPKTSRTDAALLPQDNRVHTRTIYVVEVGAKTIEMFSNVVELLEGLYDVIRGKCISLREQYCDLTVSLKVIVNYTQREYCITSYHPRR